MPASMRRRGRRSVSHSRPRQLGLEALEPRVLLSTTEAQQALELFRLSPALFVENQGQWPDQSVRFAHDGSGADVALTDRGPVFQVFRTLETDRAEGGDGLDRDAAEFQMLQFSASFLGANLVTPVGLEQAETVFNYHVGDDPARWRQGVPSYEVVAYEGLYNGIDLHTWGLRSHLKYEFQVAPGADWSQIAVHYEGIESLSLAEDGSLVVDLGEGWGTIVDDAPYIYQEIDGQKVEVPGRFRLLDSATYAFEITGEYDAAHSLVIDPDLAWSTYLGGSDYDVGSGIAVDASGAVYVTGKTDSAGWTSGGFDTTYNGPADEWRGDAFVVKLTPTGGHAWSTYLGGDVDDRGRAIAVDASGAVYVTGWTDSAGWTSGGFDTTYNGNDAFVVKLTPSGGHAWSTYLGGSDADWGEGIAVDASGAVYVAGETQSAGWTSGGFDTSHNGGSDGFVAKITGVLHVLALTPGPLDAVTSASAVAATFSASVDPGTISAQTFTVVAAGPDGTLGTGDDQSLAADSIDYDPETRTATFRYARGLPEGRYEMRLADRIQGELFGALDGEGNYTMAPVDSLPSGDGVPGGDLVSRFVVDATPPATPQVTSPSHDTRTWSGDETIEVRWWGAQDALSGVAGYWMCWDRQPDTDPFGHQWADAGETSDTSMPLGDGDSHYFHLAASDRAGNRSAAQHLGPFWIETGPPTIEATWPQAGDVVWDLRPTPRVEFADWDVDEATVVAVGALGLVGSGGDGTFDDGNEVPVPGEVRYDPTTRTATFTPSGDLPAGDAYRFTVAETVADVHGNALESPVVVEFGVGFQHVSGHIAEDTFWRGGYVVDDTVTVEPGVTLTIGAGSIVKFSDGAGLVIQGGPDHQKAGLVIEGTRELPVILTSLKDDTVGGDTNGDGNSTGPARGDWRGIEVYESGLIELDGFEVRYATTGINADHEGARATLRNGVIRDSGGHGIYVYSPYVEITGENLLIADNEYAGVFVRADSRHVFRNCTIVGNGFGGSGWAGAGIHLGGAALTLENCIVAFNGNGLHHSGDPPLLTVRNSDFYNPAGEEVIWDGDPGEPDLAANGNITADPGFLDLDGGNYDLAPNSPAIDSGTGVHAPEADLLGRPRHDDLGMPNIGTGYPAYVDMGAYERQEDTQAADLAVTYVSNPEPAFVAPGEPFAIAYTVANEGSVECVGTWQDAVYLSRDPYLDTSEDMLVATVEQTGPLAPQDAYAEDVEIAVPDVSGPMYVLVRTNADGGIVDSSDVNNVAVSLRVVGVDVPVLQVRTPVNATVVAGDWHYYRFEAEAGRTVLFTLDADGGPSELYIRETVPPTVSEYDAAGVEYGQADQQVRLLEPIKGTYFVGVLSTGSYTLRAEYTSLDIREVVPREVGNAGRATLKIIGDDFDPEAEVQLVASDATVIEGAEYWQDSDTLFATFDLAAAVAEPGSYDVVITNPGPEAVTAQDEVTVLDGGAPHLDATLRLPGMARPGRRVNVTIDYGNSGTTDLTSPLFTLTADTEVQLLLPGYAEPFVSEKARFLGLSTDGPAGVLRPGQSESVVVEVTLPPQSGYRNFVLRALSENSSEYYNDPVWSREFAAAEIVNNNPAAQSLIDEMYEKLGATWAAYIDTLTETASNMKTRAGLLVYDEAELRSQALAGHFSAEHGKTPGPTGFEALAVQPETATLTLAGAGEEQYYRPLGIQDESEIFIWDESLPNDPQYEYAPARYEKWRRLTPEDIADLYNRSIVLIIHGWLSGWGLGQGESVHSWVSDMAHRIAAYDPGKTVLVGNWERAAKGLVPRIEPFTPSRRIRQTAQLFASNLHDWGVDPTKIHIVGHSHGAYVAGLIGEAFKRFGGSIRHITALEPSEEASHRKELTRAWGPDSADYVDCYKTSELAGAETPFGDDSFRLAAPGHWSDHDYAHKRWYTDTIGSTAEENPWHLGYEWSEGDWGRLMDQYAGGWVWARPPESSHSRWRALINGDRNWFEICSQAFGREDWNYPGTWTEYPDKYAQAVHKGSDADPQYMYDCMLSAIDYRVEEFSIAEQSGLVAGQPATMNVRISNWADNASVNLQKRRQWHDGILAQGKRIVCVYLSQDPQWDESDRELRLLSSPSVVGESMGAIQFIKAVGDPGGDNFVDLNGWRVEIPGPEEFDQLPADCYLILRAAWEDDFELAPNDNQAVVPVTIGQGLAAHAEKGGEYWLDENQSSVTVTLDGTRSVPVSPQNPIDKFVWSHDGNTKTGPIVTSEFQEGVHEVTLTVYEYFQREGDGDDQSDQDTIKILVRRKRPEGENKGAQGLPVAASWTPEDKFGPAGYDAAGTPAGSEVRHIPADQTLDYRIEFWNKEDAPVPTQDAIISDPLDPNVFDLSTFEFTRYGFLKWDYEPPDGTQVVDTRIDLRPDMNLAVEVKAGLGMEVPGFAHNDLIDENTLVWWFHAIDPQTGESPEDPMAGFLPPYNPDTGYELGWVEFTVEPKADLPSGTQLANQALVEFDFLGDLPDHPAPKDGPWVNTIDSGAPTSQVEPLPATLSQTDFTVEWTGQDDTGGSGIATYDIYVSTDGGPYTPWQDDTTETSATFTGEYGHTYAFYSVARDNVGHQEPIPAVADATTEVNPLYTHVLTPGARTSRWTFTDGSGNPVTVVLGGRVGSATIARAVEDDEPGDILSLTLDGTDANSTLTITTRGRATTTVGDIVVHGSLRSLIARTTDLLGNLTVDGTLRTLMLRNVAENHMVDIGAPSTPRDTVRIALAEVDDLTLHSQTPIASLAALDWQDSDAAPDEIVTPWLGRLTIRGDHRNNLNGDFEADINLSGLGAGRYTLGSARIAGGVNGTTWDIAGDAGSMLVSGAVDNWTLNVHSDLGYLRLGDVANATVSVDGEARSVQATRWQQGSLSAKTIGSLRTRGDRRNQVEGDFNAQLTLSGDPEARRTLNSATIAGGANGTTWDITGDAGSVLVSGAVDNWTLNVHSDLRYLRLGDVANATVSVDGQARSVQATRWQQGSLSAKTIGSLRTRGDRRNQVEGDFNAQLTLSGDPEARRTLNYASIAGGLTGNWTIAGDVGSIRSGDATGWNLQVNSEVGSLSLGKVSGDTQVSVDDGIRYLRAASWDGGSIEAAWIGYLGTTGNRRAVPPDVGDSSAAITLSGTDAPRGTALRSASIAGSLTGGAWTVQTGDVGTVRALSFAPGWTLDAATGDVRTIYSRGNFSGQVNAKSLANLYVRSNLQGATINLTQPPQARTYAARSITVRGWMADSALLFSGNVRSVRAGGMRDSALFAGVTGPVDQNGDGVLDLPDPAGQLALGIGERCRIQSLTVTGIRGEEFNFINTNLAAAEFGYVYVRASRDDNGGVPFGMAADTIERAVWNGERFRGLDEAKDSLTILEREFRLT